MSNAFSDTHRSMKSWGTIVNMVLGFSSTAGTDKVVPERHQLWTNQGPRQAAMIGYQPIRLWHDPRVSGLLEEHSFYF